MKILFLQPQPCIRALKYADGMRSKNFDVQLYFAYLGQSLNEFYGHGDELFDKLVRLDPEDIENGLKELVIEQGIEIVHSHNAPDFLAASAIDILGGKIPFIHDIHDLISIRNTPYGSCSPKDEKVLDAEKKAITKSDGLIFVTEGIKEECEDNYTIDKPTIVFLSYVPEKFIPTSFKRRLSDVDGKTHIVYEGTLDEINPSHYDLQDIFMAIAQQGIQLHIYPSREKPIYEAFAETNENLHYHHPMASTDLFEELTQYDFGWAGFNITENERHMDTVLPNKLMEYIVCGLPVISLNHKSQRKFIIEHEAGIVIDNIADLSERLKSFDLDKVRKRLLKNKNEFTIEGKIEKVLRFYGSFL